MCSECWALIPPPLSLFFGASVIAMPHPLMAQRVSKAQQVASNAALVLIFTSLGEPGLLWWPLLKLNR